MIHVNKEPRSYRNIGGYLYPYYGYYPYYPYPYPYPPYSYPYYPYYGHYPHYGGHFGGHWGGWGHRRPVGYSRHDRPIQKGGPGQK
ncbi:hypothetical protein [Paenibacillus dakarensis]|uniref:hypothetical protein n=1 Tax=Paenibacillus dakarensis TaxID=1527293 RepID=UPI000AAEAC22|nr:hypothetical protein [Paenibacillus dakarensis]